MTKDVIALTRQLPDARTLLAALRAAGPELRLQTIADGAVLQLCDERGRPLVSVESPILLQVPGEAERLLGPAAAGVPTPGWWVEARASTAATDAERIAGAFAGRLAAGLDGRVWPADAVPDPVPDAVAPAVAVPAAAPGHPAVDVLTERVAVVMQDRPMVALTSWLADAVRACLAEGRGLQLVTPGDTVLSLPTRMLLTGRDSRWVVRDESGGYYDGLSGAVLHWTDGAFQPVAAGPDGRVPVAAAFTAAAPADGTQLVLSLRTLHPADEQLVLGGAVEAAWRALTGAPPAGWGTAEPVGLPWSAAEFTELAHRRSPRATLALLVGAPDRPALATVRVARTTEGVEEDITLVIGHGPDEQPPLAALPELAAELTGSHRVRSLLAQRRTGRRDLGVPARFESIPVPLCFALGPDAVQQVGLSHARRPPIAATPRPLGPANRPGLLYPLEGHGGGAPGPAWTALEQLLRHLRRTRRA
ncbi:DUF6177 family protein [Kitasatospora sp. NPDC052896]|uniref:DUF6177 family protein n=1 Tax=Kitasatospora sp. NPDC052896 TaxID=3364061 RepID=UPI0037C9AFAD